MIGIGFAVSVTSHKWRDGAVQGRARVESGRRTHTRAGSRPLALVVSALRIERITDARERAKMWIEVFEPELLSNILAGDDDRLKVEVWKAMRLAAYGSPTARVEINVGPSPHEILADIARERRQREAVTVPLLPEHDWDTT